MSNKQTRTRIARQSIETVTAFLTTKNSLYLTALTFITIIAPFLHLFAESGAGGYFGFKYMSSFLNALGLPFSLMGASLLLRFLLNHTESEYKKPFEIVSALLLFVGCFYLFYVLMMFSCNKESEDEITEDCACTYYPQNAGSYNCEFPALANISILSVINGTSSFEVDERYDQYKCDNPSNLTSNRNITFSVTGSGEVAFVVYRDADFNEVSESVTLPWSVTVPNYRDGSYTSIEAIGDSVEIEASLSDEMGYSESCSGENCIVRFWFKVPR